MTPPRPPQNTSILWIVLGSLCLLVVGMSIGMSGILQQRGAAPSGQVLSQTATAAAEPITRIESRAQEGVLKDERTGMPADIRAWLQHLERIERQRRDLTLRQIGSFTVTMTQLQLGGAMDMLKDMMGGAMDPSSTETPEKPPTTERFHEEVIAAREDWKRLRDEFASLPPPAECVPIRDEYEIALRETSGMMMDLLDAVDRAFANPEDSAQLQQVVGELQAMRGKSTVIDAAGRKSDQLVGEICSKYDTPKWFSISADIGSTNMMGMPGQ